MHRLTPPEGGWTGDDLDRLPNLPPHPELIDGILVFASPQTMFRVRAVSFFEWGSSRWRRRNTTTGTFTGTGIYRDRMKLDVPFPLDLDLTQIKPRRDRYQ
ncbi:hypothetical protein JK359_06350 [Streptomyces actinomycinicus]|uniref:Uncharacterized protein n=1 Tax=Streptomyces actinomycinicus TaxID=1695166 RepID=A0A937EFT0_9ACTN|nr:hypothetical protein [Streptomyces actinomycinicus]MBL1081602.1 hypothetical protein [Streptomyces actinomycinicus]